MKDFRPGGTFHICGLWTQGRRPRQDLPRSGDPPGDIRKLSGWAKLRKLRLNIKVAKAQPNLRHDTKTETLGHKKSVEEANCDAWFNAHLMLWMIKIFIVNLDEISRYIKWVRFNH